MRRCYFDTSAVAKLIRSEQYSADVARWVLDPAVTPIGSLLVETVFAWPGIGRLLFDALLQRDYQVLLGVFFTCSAMVILFNILTDLMYRFVDPRIEAVS